MSLRQWPAPLDHVYFVCDVEREPDRAAYLNGWLRDNRIDPCSYTFASKTYGTTLGDAEAMVHYEPFLTRLPIEELQSPFHNNLRKSEISLLLNWHDVATKAAEAGHAIVMTLESDVRFPPTFLEDLEAALRLVGPDDFDFLSITSLPHLKPHRPAGDTTLRWFPPPQYFRTRTCDAMIFKGSMLKKIAASFFPCADVLDWELNYQLNLHKARCLWLDPPILSQGSGTGIYETTLV